MEKSKAVYSSEKIVEDYARRKNLQAPEQAIYTILQPELGALKMLDIGVGGGRTTYYFGQQAKSYLGIDYSEKMILYCRERFKEIPGKLEFRTLDLRDLKVFQDGSFDFVLISFNGMDLVNDEERSAVLSEIRRILSPHGLFCFSTHNIHSLDRLYQFEFRWNVFAILKNLISLYKFRAKNDIHTMMAHPGHLVINDGVHDFGLDTYYINPLAQREQLLAKGFGNIRIFKLVDGGEIMSEEDLKANKDFYLYYLCRK